MRLIKSFVKDYIVIVKNFMEDLKLNKGYPEFSLLQEYSYNGERFDLCILEGKTKSIVAIVEFKYLNGDFKKEKTTYDALIKEGTNQLIKYNSLINDNVKLFLVIFDKSGNKNIGEIKDSISDVYFLDEFPLYWELAGSRFIEKLDKEKDAVNKNYKRFKLFSRLFGIVSFIIFILSTIKFYGYFHYGKIYKSIEFNLDYPDLIIFGIGIILIILPFFRNIKTKRFEIDRDKNFYQESQIEKKNK